MRRKLTINKLLRADDIRALFSDILSDADNIDACVIVTFDNAGIIEVHRLGSLIESLGLLEAGKNILLTDGENDAAD